MIKFERIFPTAVAAISAVAGRTVFDGSHEVYDNKNNVIGHYSSVSITDDVMGIIVRVYTCTFESPVEPSVGEVEIVTPNADKSAFVTVKITAVEQQDINNIAYFNIKNDEYSDILSVDVSSATLKLLESIL